MHGVLIIEDVCCKKKLLVSGKKYLSFFYLLPT